MRTSRGTGEPLADLDAILVEAEQVPKVQRIERQATRRTKVAIIAFAIFCLVVTAWSAWNTNRIADTRAQQVVNEQAIDDLREVNRLREQQGLPQIPLPKPGEPVDAGAVAQAAAAIALDQVKNDPRFKGPQGPRGDACDSRQVGCQGPAGKDGQNGSQGQQGASGADGDQGPGPSDAQVQDGVSAYCAANPVNCIGPKGDPGQKGDTGPQGPPPYTWTWTDPGILPGDADDVTYQCVRSGGTDAQPGYSCAPAMGG